MSIAPELASTVDLAPWLTIARAYDGLHERSPRGLILVPHFFGATRFKQGDSDDAWCSAFACSVFEEAGIEHPRSARARDWLTFPGVVEVLAPRIGDLAIYRRLLPRRDSNDPNEPKRYAGHVHFWLARDRTHNLGYGGNQNNKVCAKRYARVDLLGYRRPRGF